MSHLTGWYVSRQEQMEQGKFYNRIWGGVVVGTAMENLLTKTKTFTSQVEDISKNTKTYMILLALIISLAVLIFSFFVAKIIVRTMSKKIFRVFRGQLFNLNSYIFTIEEDKMKPILNFVNRIFSQNYLLLLCIVLFLLFACEFVPELPERAVCAHRSANETHP